MRILATIFAGTGALVGRALVLHMQERCGQPQTGHFPAVAVE
jgi:translation initiation factor 2 gamma subunit (eIF-2gamma)